MNTLKKKSSENNAVYKNVNKWNKQTMTILFLACILMSLNSVSTYIAVIRK